MSKLLAGHRYRRLVSLVLGAALAGGMLAAAPAAAAQGASLVKIVTPADGANINADKVPVTIQLLPGARPPTLQVLLDFKDVTARFHRTGHTAQAVLTPKDGLLTGNNVLTAKVTGPAGATSTDQVIFQAQGLLQTLAAATPTFRLQTRVITDYGTWDSGGPGPTYEVLVGDVPHTEPAIPASFNCGFGGEQRGVWVLTLSRKSLHQTSSVDKPLCTDKEAAALKTYLGGLPNTDMVIVNSLTNGGSGIPVKGLGDALAKIGAVAAEFNGIGETGDGTITWSVEGIPGLPAGQAYQTGSNLFAEATVDLGEPTPASINATLVQDNYANYTLAMRDYVTFDIPGTDGSITVGGHTYPSPALPDPANFAGGYHVLVLDRRTLSVISDKLYETAKFNSGAGPDQAAMANDLTTLASSSGESVLVLVASVINPMDFGQQTGIAAPTIAQALAPFGGTPDVIDTPNKPPYALVGAISPPAAYGLRRIDAPEASPTINAGATGELDGVLQRGTRGMWYSPAGWNAPAIIDINGQQQVTAQNYGLYQVIGQAPTPWPVPVPPGQPDHAGELAAYQYLSDQACSGCKHDLRSYYASEEATISTWQTVIESAQNPGSYTNPDTRVTTPISQDQFTTVKGNKTCNPTCGLLGELQDVFTVDGLRDSMHMLLSDSNQMAQPTLTDAYNDVAATIKPPSSSQVGTAVYDILELLQAVVDIASLGAQGHGPAAEEPEENGISEGIGLVAALVEASNDLTDDSNGALQDQLQTTVGNLGQQAKDNFAASLTGLDETFAEIFSDWGRLSAVADGLRNHPGQWDISGEEGQIVTAMTNAMKIGYYRALIPLVYSAEEGANVPSPDPKKWCAPDTACFLDGSETHNHEPYVLGSSAYSYPVNDPTNGFAVRYHMVIVGKTPIFLKGEGANDPFPPALMSDLTSNGYYPGWLFLRFPFARTICPAGYLDPFQCYDDLHP